MPDTNSYRTSKQHPVPQNIMNVEFKLIGDLTIKQFGYVAVGLVSAFLAYKSGLYFVWRWFLVFVCVALGVGMAFVPVQDRGLDIWIKSFIKALFSPVIMVWRKEPKTPHFIQVLDEFLAESPQTVADTSRFEKKVELAEVLSKVPSELEDPLEKRREDFIRSLDLSSFSEPAFSAPSKVEIAPKAEISSQKSLREEPGFLSQKVLKPQEPSVLEPAKPVSTFFKVKPLPKKTVSKKPQPAFDANPNVVHGILYDKTGKLLEGAVVLIKESDGDPVRALKSNALGRFQITTPLENGDYLLEVRHKGERFDIMKISLKGEKMSPLEIKAKVS